VALKPSRRGFSGTLCCLSGANILLPATPPKYGTSGLLHHSSMSALAIMHSPKAVFRSNVRIADIHVSLCQGKSTSLFFALWRARCSSVQELLLRTFASRLVVPALAEPDIHLLSKTPKSPHRRLSLCSLPVPKQFTESLRSLISFAQAVGDLACINLVVLLFGRSNRSQHQRMRDLHLLRMRKQMIVDPAREDRRFHRDRPGLWQRHYPGIQLAPGRSDLAFPVHLTSRILHAVADRLLVNVKPDVLHIVSEEPPWCSLNQRPLSSAFL